MQGWPELAAELALAGVPVDAAQPPRRVAGGDTSDTWRVATQRGPAFLKTGQPGEFDKFACEADGLTAIAATGTIRVPEVLACDRSARLAFLALEWLSLVPTSGSDEAALGEQLAALHAHTGERFGWHRDNWIGGSPQPNTRYDDWATFFARERLGFQLGLAREHGHTGELYALGQSLCDGLDPFFANHTPAPALLHGDLWGGNWGHCDGQPVVFDPAVYYGDPEADLAMTRLFGGFGLAFYAAYDRMRPRAHGADARDRLYRLYHVLNHLNLFGGGYRTQALHLIRELLALRDAL